MMPATAMRLRSFIDDAVRALFAAGEQGAWYDPSDLGTLFQDSIGTMPVTAPGQPVGLMLDKSGNDHHAAQATATARPLLQQDGAAHYYLDFDGIDDFMASSSIDCSATDKMSVWLGVEKSTDIRSVIATLCTSAFDAGSFGIECGPGSAYCFLHVGTSSGQRYTTEVYPAPTVNVLFCAFDLAPATLAEEIKPRVDGVIPAFGIQSGIGGTGNYGNHPLKLGGFASGTVTSAIKVYSVIVRAAAAPADPAPVEGYVNSKTGAY